MGYQFSRHSGTTRAARFRVDLLVLLLFLVAHTLALGSLLSLLSIVFGSALAMKVEYYCLDDMGYLRALRQSLSDMKLLPR
jgi:hypothetical protein